MRLIGGQRVENVELVCARARQLHLGAHENLGPPCRSRLSGCPPTACAPRSRPRCICGVMAARICSSSIWLMRSEAVAPRAQRRVRCTRAGRRGLGASAPRGLLNLPDEEVNRRTRTRGRKARRQQIASLRVSNMEVRSWAITPKTRRMTSAATVIASDACRQGRTPGGCEASRTTASTMRRHAADP